LQNAGQADFELDISILVKVVIPDIFYHAHRVSDMIKLLSVDSYRNSRACKPC
jgi:hypothetical protein